MTERTVFPRWWAGKAGAAVAAVSVVAVLAAAAAWVDLTPSVEGDFFFAEDDPQLAASRAVEERFPGGGQILLRVEAGGVADGADPGAPAAGPERTEATGYEDEASEARMAPAYREALGVLVDSLRTVDGIRTLYSTVTHDARGPLYRRVLLPPDPAATNVVLLLDDSVDAAALVARLETVVATAPEELEVVLSGVPVIVERIRRALFRDLVVFSTAAALVFTLLIGLVYRDPAVVAGMLATCTLSVGATLLTVRAAGVSIGLLTANLVTIVIVLTLSHLVFLTGNWRRAAPGLPRPEGVDRAVRETFEASFWSMATTLLGFLSLLVASAEPLRELGIAGAVGTLAALAAAYLVFPTFLGGWARLPGPPDPTPSAVPPPAPGSGRRRRGLLGVTALAVLLLGAGVARLDTDPGLLTYFDPDGSIRRGLEQVDADGGSSVLNLVVRDAGGGRIDTPEAYRRLQAFQAALEADPVVGVVLSPAVLIEQARTMPLARLLPIPVLLDLASSPRLDGVALGYVTEERTRGLYSIRLRESMAGPPRGEVMARLAGMAAEAGLEVETAAGFYDLQRQLGTLIADSLKVGVGGLLVLFLLVAWIVSRSLGTTVRMWLCLAGIPLVVLGTFGWLGEAVDIITAPAANIALAMGVDSMIHLVVQFRRRRRAGAADPWGEALGRVRGPVLGAAAIIVAGFGIFVLSSFPPTARFGGAVILGTVTAAVMTLRILPGWAAATPR